MISREEQERRKRDAIASVAADLRRTAEKSGGKLSQEDAERRVRKAALKDEAQQG